MWILDMWLLFNNRSLPLRLLFNVLNSEREESVVEHEKLYSERRVGVMEWK